MLIHTVPIITIRFLNIVIILLIVLLTVGNSLSLSVNLQERVFPDGMSMFAPLGRRAYFGIPSGNSAVLRLVE